MRHPGVCFGIRRFFDGKFHRFDEPFHLLNLLLRLLLLSLFWLVIYVGSFIVSVDLVRSFAERNRLPDGFQLLSCLRKGLLRLQWQNPDPVRDLILLIDLKRRIPRLSVVNRCRDARDI